MIGVDWRIPIDEAWERIGHDRAVQGNLDPTLLLGPAARMLAADRRRPEPRRPDGPGTSSTSVTASCRRRRSSTCRCSRSTCTQRTLRTSSLDTDRVRWSGTRDRRSSTCVVGGGIAGLAAAYELQQRGLSVRVLEAGPRAGGVIPTERFDGWVIDGGPDSLLVQKPAAVALCRELGIADRLVSTLTPRTAYVLRDGRLHPHRRGVVPRLPARRRRAGALVALHHRRQAADGVRAGRAARRRRRGRIDWRVRPAPVRRGGRRLPGRAAAGRHPRRRRRPAVDAGALSAPGRGRAAVGQRHPRVPRAARHGRRRRARSSRCRAAPASSSTRWSRRSRRARVSALSARRRPSPRTRDYRVETAGRTGARRAR